VKLAPRSVDIRKWKFSFMRSIGEKNENTIVFRIDPTTCAGESIVTEAIAGGIQSRG
jgi:hypothetical protein